MSSSAALIVCEKGSTKLPAHTLKVDTPFDGDFIAEFKRLIPYGPRERDKTNRVWRVHPEYREKVSAVLVKHFERVYLFENGRQTDLRSGRVIGTQTSMF